jgi:hypothetical protein
MDQMNMDDMVIDWVNVDDDGGGPGLVGFGCVRCDLAA